MADCIQSGNAIEERSPIELAKALKNAVELEGLRQAHIRDAAALVKTLLIFVFCIVTLSLFITYRYPFAHGWRRNWKREPITQK